VFFFCFAVVTSNWQLGCAHPRSGYTLDAARSYALKDCFDGSVYMVGVADSMRSSRKVPRAGLHARVCGDACPVPPFVDGRHPDVSRDGAQDNVDRFRDEFLVLAGNTLMSLTVGVCQQVIARVAPLAYRLSSYVVPQPINLEELAAFQLHGHRVRTQHLATLTDAINHLSALEYVVATHVNDSGDLEAHDDNAVLVRDRRSSNQQPYTSLMKCKKRRRSCKSSIH